MSNIIDRRLNQGQKNLGNRQRFIRKAKDQIKKAIKDNIQNRKIGDINSGENIKIPIDTINEPSFGHDFNTGTTKRVLPGNKDYIPQDTILRPKSGGGGGKKGNEASDSDETFDDEFVFVLTKDEFYDMFFEDLELPDLIRKKLKTTKKWEVKREGISAAGNPSNVNIVRTMKQSLGRRIILRKPNEKNLTELESKLAAMEDDDPNYESLLLEIISLRKKIKSVTYVDPIDLRYNVFSKKPTPSNAAVMFCVMDVSGSMDENKKDIAKRFFMLLYLFLQKKYETVKIEFIRHHTSAERVDEQTFFYDKLSGGTMVSSALELTIDTIKKDYNPDLYNIYVCQASDGDNYESDNIKCRQLLEGSLLPLTQFMAYVEIKDQHDIDHYPLISTNSNLYNVYKTMSNINDKLQVTKASSAGDIYNVFRKLFEKK
jgi:uncharacterized sporulation protein YeaH/YhbH (DUF444 family)